MKPAPDSVQVMFLPPPTEAAVYSVGVYDAGTGRLVRRLHEDAVDGGFTAALNGFITFWDRKDDAGKTVPAGKYAARGWAVGEMRVEGVDILGNDWADEDEDLRLTKIFAIRVIPSDKGVSVLGVTANGRAEVLRMSGQDGGLVWRRRVSEKVWPSPAVLEQLDGDFPKSWGFEVEGDRLWCVLENERIELAIADGRELHRRTLSQDDELGGDFLAGMAVSDDNTVWFADDIGLSQYTFEALAKSDAIFKEEEKSSPPPIGESVKDRILRHNAWEKVAKERMRAYALRHLPAEPGQPAMSAVKICPTGKRLYLLEESPGWQRVRGLEWSETKPDADGHPVSEWRTFFERSIRRPDLALGLDEKAPSPVVELPLAKNPLEPGKPQLAKLRAGFDAKGSYLETADGLRLLPISTRPNLRAARLTRDPKAPDRLLFYQFDGAAWDVFSITGAPKALVGFDAGEFELTADGERHPLPPTEEPRDP